MRLKTLSNFSLIVLLLAIIASTGELVIRCSGMSVSDSAVNLRLVVERPTLNASCDPPTADSLFLNEHVDLVAEISSDKPIQESRFCWDLDGDGKTDVTGSRINQAQITRTPGARRVMLILLDPEGGAPSTVRVIDLSVLPDTQSEYCENTHTKRTYDFFATGFLWITICLIAAGFLALRVE